MGGSRSVGCATGRGVVMRIIGVALALAGLTACDTPNFRTSQFQFGDATTLAATGNLRFITERTRELPGGRSRVICTEPNPDYATSSDTDAEATIKSTSTTSPISEGSVAVKTTEKVTALGGRSKGVLALRDGLYAACQAYVNGLIGKDAYSIILSQYGLLLVALMQEDTYPDRPATASKGSGQVKGASAFAALFVSCINAADPTRLGNVDPRNVPTNALLTPRLCASVLQRAARGT